MTNCSGSFKVLPGTMLDYAEWNARQGEPGKLASNFRAMAIIFIAIRALVRTHLFDWFPLISQLK
jgi:hypothetical protein